MIKTVSPKRLESTVRGFRDRKVLVMGDLMLDKYIWGEVHRISPEAPVPVVDVRKDSLALGGAGNVCHNIRSLGASPVPIGVVGNDAAGRWIRRNVPDGRGIFVDRSRPTTEKTRIIAHHQQIVRVDMEQRGPLSLRLEGRIIDFLAGETCLGLILSDYGKGLFSERLLTRVFSIARDKQMLVCVDPKINSIRHFSPAALLTPNHHEAERIVGRECRTEDQVNQAGAEILASVDARRLIIKRGEQGMAVFEKGRKPAHIPAVAREIFDVTGAGDTVIAVATLALLSGADILEAATLANAAAGIVVGKIGTAAVTPEELLAAVARIK